jgi:hypothetical protein
MSLRNRLVLPIILFSLAVLAGCGSGSGVTIPVGPPSGSFSNSDLNGTYVFSVTGSDFNYAFLTTVGTLTANGSGGITGGTVDMNDPTFSAPVIGQPITGGTYTITSDGRGQATLTTSTPFGSSIAVDFVLTSNSHGLITEFDGNGTGSGTLDLQSAVTQGQITGSYAFNITGISSINTTTGAQPTLATVGAFTLDGSGNITSGVEDFNNGGISIGETDLTITSGSVSLATVPGTASLTTTIGGAPITYTFDVYPVDSTHLKFIGTDSFPIFVGDVFTQSSSIPTTNVFTVAGIDLGLQGPFTAAGLIVTDGTSAITSASTEDINDAGSAFQVTSFSGTYTALSGGRSVLTLNGFANGTSGSTGNYQFAAYPSSGGLQLLEIDNGGITDGIAYPQTSTTVTSGQGYGFNLTGINTNGEEDDIAEFTNSSGTFTGIVDSSDQTPQGILSSLDQKFVSAYTADTTINGRGVITATTNAFNLVTYTVDASTSVFVEVDSGQVGLGSFGQQTPTAKSNVAAMHLAALHVRTGAKSALRRKQK